MLKSKIHKARLTGCELNYEGSLEVDLDLLKASGILPYEKILIVNTTNGERLETYAIPAPAGSKIIRFNGAAARRGVPGDMLTIMAFGLCSEPESEIINPTIIILDEKNNIVETKGRAI